MVQKKVSVFSEVSSFQNARVVLGKSVLFRELSSIQGCPYREGFHCNTIAHTKVPHILATYLDLVYNLT